MPYVINVTTEPDGARVRASGGGSGSVTGAGEIARSDAPEEAVGETNDPDVDTAVGEEKAYGVYYSASGAELPPVGQ